MINLPEPGGLLALLLGCLLVLLIVYIFPFIVSPLLRLLAPLWGFIVGRRRRRAIPLAPFPGESAENVGTRDQWYRDIVHNEFQYLAQSNGERLEMLRRKLEEIREQRQKVENNYHARRENSQKHLLGRSFSSLRSQLNREAGKNLLLLVLTSVILLIDALIARQIFTSLGLYSTPEPVPIGGGITIPIDYATVYGLFLTVTTAFVLHLVWDRSRFVAFIKNAKRVGLIGVAILGLFYVIRLATMMAPDQAPTLMESIMLLCWITGVVSVYWLVGEIVGDTSDWFKLTVAVAAPVLVVLLFFVAGLALLELVLEWLTRVGGETWLSLRRARTSQQERNAEEVSQKVKGGFYRGLTF